MSEWTTVADACDLVTDGTHYTPKNVGRGVPFLTVRDVSDVELDFVGCSFISELDYMAAKAGCSAPTKGDVLFSKDGTVGKVHVVTTDRPFAVLSSLAILRPKKDFVEAGYLGHALRSPKVVDDAARKRTGSAIRRIVLSDLKRVVLPVPPISEQRRIAAILDKADALRSQRREALACLEELGSAVFLEMFASNRSSAWPVGTIADAAMPEAGAIRTGPFGSQLLHSEFVDSGVAVLGIDNVVGNEFRWAQRRYITESKYERLKRYTVKPGDVLITIMGTCGRCAVVPDDVPVAINTKHLCCITLDRTKVLPLYLHSYFLRHPIARRYLEQTAKGAIMSGLNMGIIQAMPLIIPPIETQAEFVKRVGSIESVKASHRASLTHLDALFASLQHRAFRGEL